MSRIARYWSLWRSLPPAERHARAGRVADRLLLRRFRPRNRGLSTISTRRAFSIDLDRLVRRLRADDPTRGPLFGDLDSRAAIVSRHCPGHVARLLDRTEELLARRFDLLGSGPAAPLLPDGRIDWQRDWIHGSRWDASTYCEDLPLVRDDGSDVKVPWELSRFQHLLVLGQAYRLAPHRLPADASRALRSRCAGEAVEQIDDWIDSNPRGLGIHWSCAMEVALRAVSWTAALAFFRDSPEWDDAFLKRLVRSLWLHGLHVRRHLEREPATNHYLSDLLGLLAIGRTLPEIAAAAEWVELATRELVSQAERQVGPDGVGFERSLPYHRLTAEILLHAVLLAGRSALPRAFRERLTAMLEFTSACTRPDGTVPQWGDNDNGRVLPLAGYATRTPQDHRHLLALGARIVGGTDCGPEAADAAVEALWLLGPDDAVEDPPRRRATSRGFADSGFYVLQTDDLHLAIGCGPVGTLGLGNHSHNDLFSVCVWADGREWITDPGTGVYGADIDLRNRLRATAAHATLQLDDREQNEIPAGVDGLFRLVERAAPEVIEWRTGPTGGRLSACHRGFSGSDGDWIHRRDVEFEGRRRRWIIDDELRGDLAGDPPAEQAWVWLRFPLAPGVVARLESDPESGPAEAAVVAAEGDRLFPIGALARLSDEAGRRFWIGLGLPAGSRIELVSGPVSPSYGRTESAVVLVARIPLASTVRCRTALFSPYGASAARPPDT